VFPLGGPGIIPVIFHGACENSKECQPRIQPTLGGMAVVDTYKTSYDIAGKNGFNILFESKGSAEY
jgi:hypothetical protein